MRTFPSALSSVFVQAVREVAGQRYRIEVEHSGLGKYQCIQGTDPYVVEQRAAAKRHEWEQQWRRQCAVAEKRLAREREREQRAEDKEARREYLESRKLEAEEATAVAEHAIAQVEGLLEHTLGVDDRVDFEALKDRTTFAARHPDPPKSLVLPERPTPLVAEYSAPLPSFWTQLFEILSPAAKMRRLEANAAAEQVLRQQTEAENAQRSEQWRSVCVERQREHAQQTKEYEKSVADWRGRKNAFESRQAKTNASIDQLRHRYETKESDAIEQYCEMVLTASSYPESFPQTYSLQYRQESRLLLVEYVLPLPAHVPKVKSVRYVQSRDELAESEVSEAAQKKLYDAAIYQVVIRTLHELFEADVVEALDSIAFNGVVETVDAGTGNPIRPCIVSVQVSKTEFEQLNLSAVEPKACFRKLKGIGSAQLHALAPVPPIIRFNKDDVRFVDGRDVLDGVGEGQNIASMPWEDFEHLIRDLFEREFAAGDADVRITRASRDGGVDAVIFDPDPIRGGKLVVQAKRYTNTVGVSAVRDLYGAMTAERAAKGILVTTASFGSDSYEFAKDKPITLLDGGGLLHLLQKHGVPAVIDLQQARNVARN